MARPVDIKPLDDAPTPSLLKLKTMKGPDGKNLKIIPRIAAGDYVTFGMCLLQDENGVDVDLLKKTHDKDGPRSATAAIIQKWLTSGAAPTRTYQHLIECLRESELGALAEDIANTIVAKDVSTACSTASQESEQMITSRQTIEHSATTASLAKQSYFSTEHSSSQKKKRTTITPNTDPHITSYSSYLGGLYTLMSQSRTSSQHWTHLPQCEFVQLAMIRGEELRGGGPEEEMIRLAQQGKIETIVSQKQEISLKNIFPSPPIETPPTPPPSPSTAHPMSHQFNEHSQPNIDKLSILPTKKQRVVLVEGAPGGGKSTLVLHICHKWAQGAWFLSKFDIVVLAYLREKAIQNASTLANILPAKNYPHSVTDVATQIINSNGFRVLFIFDGWDEFPPHLQKQSLVSTIIHEPHELCLQQSTVIITTRPVASGNLLYIADQRVEILGFTVHQIREYIEKSLNGDSTRIQKLVQHLKDHPVIEGYCYIPLHVAILVSIFLIMKGALPTTLHELFCNLVLCCIVRELKTHESDQTLDAKISSLDDLPDNLKSQLSDLSILAYEGVMQDKVIFYEEDLKALHLSTNLPSLGLLQAVEGLTLTSYKSRSYNFLHLSVQELLAAYHISQMNPITQVEVFRKLFGSPRFEAVLHYYCGFTKLENPAIQDFIYSYSKQQTSFKDVLPLLHCFFEAQQPRLAQLIDHKFTDIIDMKELLLLNNPVNYIVVGYFISSLLSMSTSDEPNSMQLKIGDNVNDYQLKLLLSQLSRCSIVRRLQVDMRKASITGIGVQHLASHLKQSQSAIGELSIVGVDKIHRYEYGLLRIAEALRTNCHLTELHIVGLICISENDSALTKMLHMNKTLAHLHLSSIGLSLSGAHYIFQGLQQNTTLIHLNLASNRITGCEEMAQALTTMLHINKALTHLNLSYNRFSDLGALCIFQGLQQNTTLTHLNLASNEITGCEDTTRALTTMLQVNTSLTHLILSHNVHFSSGAHSIFKTLQHNTTLVHLDLSQTGMHINDIESTFQTLNEMLKMNKTLAYLNLSNNTISDPNTCSIFQGLQHNTALVHLDLHDMNKCISDEVAVCIGEALESNRSLQVLDIRYSNQIGREGFDRIAKSLESHAALRELHLFLGTLTMIKKYKLQAIHSKRKKKGLHHVSIVH